MKTMTQFLLFYVLIHACCCFFVFPHSFTTNTTLTTCLPHQTSILLQLKTEFTFYSFGYDSFNSYPKMKHWNIEGGNGDCCFWDGVSCNLATGYVIGLDLSSSWLHGPLRSNSSLFRLLHLQKLNLAFNYFTECLIPSELGRLSRLTYLNLSTSHFSGQKPYEISTLKNLIVLDLSENHYLFARLIINQNMTNLRHLELSGTNISGKLPDSIGNLKSLNFLGLSGCGFSGIVPPSLSNLTQLSYLALSQNDFNGKLPYALGNLENLTSVDLAGNNFSGQIPSSFENLTKLEELDLSNNFLDGKLPITFPHNINSISLRKNSLTGSIPSSCIANLTILYNFNLAYNSLTGVIPSFLFNLPSLETLILNHNQFTGSLNIHNISNSSRLMYLDLMGNKLTGDIPNSMFQLIMLINLLIDKNNLNGRLDFGMFSALSSLKVLSLSENRELSITNLSTKSTLPKLDELYLASCNNITEFPMFLKTQTQLQYLDLSNNRIGGQIPKWLLSLELRDLNLSHNSITGWEEATLILPWESLFSLDLHSNMLRGRLVVPPMSTWYFSASENSLSGSIDPLFCKLGDLGFLELSSNNLSGTIPRCLGNSATSLKFLNLRRNNFHGKMPKICGNGSPLMTLDLSSNQLHGKIPKSLTECKELEILNLGHNQMSDSFPFWLQNSSKLRVLVLSSNKFYGPIWRPHNFLGFSNLKIIDLSFNDFTGSLPAQYFRNWTSMAQNSDGNRYIGNYFGNPYINRDHYYSMTVMNKGQEMGFLRILPIFLCIDLSNNRFYGEIPTTTGGLGSLIVLNLSSNSFAGHIPSSMRNLTMLESLDLSNNKLSGEIPLQLSTALRFLGYLNLSNNQFVGQIPQGGQIGTFPNSSFLGNLGLCGRPLSKMCGTPSPNNDQNDTSRDDSIMSGFTWKAVAIGYGCGVAIGVVGGHIIISRSPYLMWMIFRVRTQRRLRR